MRSRLTVLAGVCLLVLAAALINSRRGQRLRAEQLPAPGTSSAPPKLSVPLILNCLAPGSTVVEEARTQVPVPGRAGLQVLSRRCANPAADRLPSIVQLLDPDDDGRIVSTLIKPLDRQHVQTVLAVGSTVTITSSVDAPETGGTQPPPPSQGRAVQQSFTVAADLSVQAAAPVVLGERCRPGQLQVKALNTGAQQAVLRLRNASTTPCVLEGYPLVQGLADTQPVLTATSRRAGSAGGLSEATVPPVLVLAPGATASAALDSADLTPAGGPSLCSLLQAVRILLPDGEIVGDRALPIRVCQFQVHPLVAGDTGRD